MRVINAPSLANSGFLEMDRQTAQLVEGGVQWFHIDIMDGHYVPNLCFPVRLVGELKQKYPHIMADVHLMVTDPAQYVDILAHQGADYVSFHLDATPFVIRTLHAIREKGMKAGVVLNPSQPIDLLLPVLHEVDYVVLMTVEPGFAGQRFMPAGIERARQLVRLRREAGRDFLISIDGGVDMQSAKLCARMGVEVFVTGMYTIFGQPDGILGACKRFEASVCADIEEGEQNNERHSLDGV